MSYPELITQAQARADAAELRKAGIAAVAAPVPFGAWGGTEAGWTVYIGSPFADAS